MQVILLEKIRNLGNLGDKVNVAAGYARNFLVPQGKAASATPENLAKFEAQRVEFEKAAKEAHAQAQLRAEKLAQLESITISAKVGEEGKLFGSIGARDIASAITAAGCHVDKNEIILPQGPIRLVGEHEIQVQLHSDISSTVKITITAGG